MLPLSSFQPMPLMGLAEPFDHPDWLFELKYDGFRALAYIYNGQARLVSRRKNIYKSFPNLCAAIAGALNGRGAVLDGEIVCLDSQGCPQFNQLLYRRGNPVFYAFDVLWLNGRDLRNMPLVKRKERLRYVLPRQSNSLLYVDHMDGKGEELFDIVCRRDLEGIVGKWKLGKYTPDETSWVKIKNRSYTQIRGRDELFEARVQKQAAGL